MASTNLYYVDESVEKSVALCFSCAVKRVIKAGEKTDSFPRIKIETDPCQLTQCVDCDTFITDEVTI